MTDQEKLEIQGKKLAELTEENENLKDALKQLAKENEVLLMSKSDIELSLVNEKREIDDYIVKYKTLIDECKEIKEAYLEAKNEYVKAIVEIKKRIKKFGDKIKA